MPDWGEPILGQRSHAHDFTGDPVVVAEFQRTDTITVEDRFSDLPGAVRSQTVHRLLDNGVEVDVWGSADLDGKLRMVKPGSLVRIVYVGLEELENGRKIKRFTVQVDQSDPAAAQVAQAQADDDDIPF